MHDLHRDDYASDLLQDQQRQELVGKIWEYALALEKYVVTLRRQVNKLAVRQNIRTPYPDLVSDFMVRFFPGYPAYEEFKEVLSIDETDWILPG